jgi:hypothetical protein
MFLQVAKSTTVHLSWLQRPNRNVPFLWCRNVYQSAQSETNMLLMNSFKSHTHHQICTITRSTQLPDLQITPLLQFVILYSVYSAFLLSVSWATQLSRDVPSDTSFLRGTAAVIGEVIKILCVWLPPVVWAARASTYGVLHACPFQ